MKVKKNKDESGKLYNMILKSQTNNDKACGTQEISETRKRNMQSIVDEWTRQNDKTTTSSTNFEVYFHVIHDGSRGDLSDSNIIDSIRVLNNGFSGYVSATCIEPEGEDDEVTIDDCFGPTGGGQLQETIDYIIANTPFFSNEKTSQVNEKRRMETSFMSNSVELSKRVGNTDLGISFTLKGITRTNDANFFDNIDSNIEYKTYLRQGDCRTLNIYSGASQHLGWSRYPDQCSGSMIDDGVVINYQTVPGGEDPTNNEGHTLTHGKKDVNTSYLSMYDCLLRYTHTFCLLLHQRLDIGWDCTIRMKENVTNLILEIMSKIHQDIQELQLVEGS